MAENESGWRGGRIIPLSLLAADESTKQGVDGSSPRGWSAGLPWQVQAQEPAATALRNASTGGAPSMIAAASVPTEYHRHRSCRTTRTFAARTRESTVAAFTPKRTGARQASTQPRDKIGARCRGSSTRKREKRLPRQTDPERCRKRDGFMFVRDENVDRSTTVRGQAGGPVRRSVRRGRRDDRARVAMWRLAADGHLQWSTKVVRWRAPRPGTMARSVALAPATTTMQFSPLSSTRIVAQPVGASSRATPSTLTPSRHSIDIAASANASLPPRRTVAPSRRHARRPGPGWRLCRPGRSRRMHRRSSPLARESALHDRQGRD